MRRKPPEGFVSWGKPTFERLVASEPEPLRSSFAVSHAMLLGVVSRPGDAFASMRHLLTDNDEDPVAQRRHIRHAFAIYRALVAGDVVERLAEPDEQGRRWRLTVDLQSDFALNQPLSPLALAAIELLDRESPALPAGCPLGDRGHPRRPAAGPVGAAIQGPRRGRRADEGRRRRVRGADEPAGLGHLPPAPAGPARSRLQHVPQGPPLGGGLSPVAQVGRTGHVRAGDDLRRVRRLLRAVTLGGAGPSVPGRRVQGPAPDGARGGTDRGPGRPDRVAGGAGPAGRLQPDR